MRLSRIIERGVIMSKSYASRMISNEFIKELKEGILKDLTDNVCKDKELLMCFRGYDASINIYYLGMNLVKIDKISDYNHKYKVQFCFNYAKFSDDWETKLEKYRGMSFYLNNIKNEGPKGRVNGKQEVNNLYANIDENSTINWGYLISENKASIIKYFESGGKRNWFSNQIEKTKAGLERQREQEIHIRTS